MEVSALTHPSSMPGLRGPSALLRLQSDERLIALTRKGQHAAFETLCARYQSRLLSFCRHMLASREDAEDVLQEVFAAAFNAVLADEREINVRPWLYRIARNRSLNHLRRAAAIGVDSHGRPLRRERHLHRRQGAAPRELPRADRRRARAARDAAHRAAAARDRRALLRADRAGDGDHRAVRQVAARARPHLARRGRRGAQAQLRGGPPRARRSGRGADQAGHTRAPPRARLRALLVLQEAAAGEQPRARRDHARGAAAARQEGAARQARLHGLRRRRARGRGGRHRREPPPLWVPAQPRAVAASPAAS